MFAVGCPQGFPALAGANVDMSMHKIEYLLFDKLIMAPDLMDHHVRWHLTRTRLTALCRDIANVGTAFVVVDGVLVLLARSGIMKTVMKICVFVCFAALQPA